MGEATKAGPQFLCVALWEKSVGEGACLKTHEREHYLVALDTFSSSHTRTTSEKSIACMNFKMPCNVSLFENVSTFVTFLLFMPLNVGLCQFGSGCESFSTLCTDILRHGVATFRAELAKYVPKK